MPRDEPLVLGIDLGSSAAKAVLATSSGDIVERASIVQWTQHPAPGFVEQRPEAWWETLCQLAATTLGGLSERGRLRLVGVAIAGHFPTLLLGDSDGNALMPAMLYSDRRADPFVGRAAALAHCHLRGDEILPKLLWLKSEHPALLAQTRMLFGPIDYLVWRLTGVRATDRHTASRYGGLFDPEGSAWRVDVLGALGLDPSALPPVTRSADMAGTVTEEAAAESQIPAGTPVLVGTGDTLASLVGAGVVQPGDVLLCYGTTATADVCSHPIRAYLQDPSETPLGGPYHEVAYCVLAPALEWGARGLEPLAGAASKLELGDLDGAAASLGISKSDPYVLPFFMEHARAHGPVRRPAFVGLDVEHGRAHVHRAMQEGFGYLVRAGLEDSGWWGRVGRIVATGGGAVSANWRQIVTDVLAIEQSWFADADAALGAAMLVAWARCGADVFSLTTAHWLRDPQSTVPNTAAHWRHVGRYRTWCRLRDAIGRALEE